MKPLLLAALTAAALISNSAATAATTVNFAPLAGQGVVLDHTDGNGTSALFFNPQSVAVDASGNVYVADSGDHTVRIINTAGTSSVLAGSSGVAGNVNGTGSAARFDYPYGIAVGTDNSVYVTDVIDGTVRKITSGGVVTTLASGLNGPQGVAVDASNNVYISDTNNSSIKKIPAGGSIAIFAGSATNAAGTADGTGTAASFNFPAGLATDSAGDVYVADFGNSSIRMITPAGKVTTIAGSTTGASGYTNATGTAALFNHPAALAVDANNNIYVVDTSNQLIREITAGTFVVNTVAGSFSNVTNSGVIGSTNAASATTSTFFYPQGIAVNAAGTTIFIADTGSHKIREITGGNFSAGTGTVSTYAGSIGASGATNTVALSATFKAPYGVAVDGSGNVFIADQGNNLIRELSGGNVSTLAGTAGLSGINNGPGASATFNNPSGVAVDSQDNVYVADTGNNVVRKITAAGVVSTFASGFSSPEGIATDSAGNVYVADSGHNTVDLITAAGAVSTIATGFNGPNALVVDSAGNVYVSDFKNDVIKKLTKSGTSYAVTTLAGTAGVVGDVDGAGTSARFNSVYGITVDASGNVYVTDTLNRVVRQITPSGQVSTVTGTQARFFYPEGIAIDDSGNLYVVDADNNSLDEGVVVSAITTGLANHTVAPGGTATFSIVSPGSGAYQWQVSTNGVDWTNVTNGASNGAVYSGATTSALTISGATTGMNGTEYRAVTSSSTSPAGTLYVGNVRLLNLSSSGFVGTAGTDLVAGFVIGGTGTKNILLRGIGPSLAAFSVADPLPQPTLTLYTAATTPTVQATNTIWGGTTALVNAMNAVGAFTIPTNSADSALYMSGSTALGAGSHTAHVSSASTTTGEALVEVYDADTGTPSARLTNISTSALVGSVNLVAGFVIGGTTSETVLIRGVGPGLAPLGVANPLSNVMLTVYGAGSSFIASNNGWSTSDGAQLSATFTQVGAFSLPPNSNDSALLLTLAPGSYTAIVTGVGGATGTALVEIYEVP
jgi:DNA-binding beta-propeller fold protein YncE